MSIRKSDIRDLIIRALKKNHHDLVKFVLDTFDIPHDLTLTKNDILNLYDTVNYLTYFILTTDYFLPNKTIAK